MNVKATAKYIHIAPRKTRLVVALVRGLGIEEARRQLMFSSKAAAKPVLKALNSAIANAQNNHSLDTTNFIVTMARVDEGPTFHRFRERARGTAAPIRKRMSHLILEVGPRGGASATVAQKPEEKDVVKAAVEKKAVKKTVKKTAKKTEAKANK